ncbi:MAG: VOC family protein [Bacteroidales bacterium]|nr:VOC family protein [Bacteroidales bacterium]
MLDSFKFHHIGVAVKDLEATASVYAFGGYHCSSTIFDPIQNVYICWLTKDGFPTVELLAPVDEKSPVNKTLEKVGVSPYHFCYVVDNLEDAVAELRKQRYIAVSKPVEAVAFLGSRVCFLYNKNVGLVELVEAPAKIIE